MAGWLEELQAWSQTPSSHSLPFPPQVSWSSADCAPEAPALPEYSMSSRSSSGHTTALAEGDRLSQWVCSHGQEDWASLIFKGANPQSFGSNSLKALPYSNMTRGWWSPCLLLPLQSKRRKIWAWKSGCRELEHSTERQTPRLLSRASIDIYWLSADRGSIKSSGVTEDWPQRKIQKYHIACAKHSANLSPVPEG